MSNERNYQNLLFSNTLNFIRHLAIKHYFLKLIFYLFMGFFFVKVCLVLLIGKKKLTFSKNNQNYGISCRLYIKPGSKKLLNLFKFIESIKYWVE